MRLSFRTGKMSSLIYSAIILTVLGTCSLATTSNQPDQQETVEACTREMFGNSSAALQACKAQFSLQRNWYPDPIQGLFSYQTWNGMDGFWQNGVVLETMANCLHYLNNTRYRSVVVGSDRSLDDLLLAYGPQPSFDDMAWYGLAYSRIYEASLQTEGLHWMNITSC